MAKMSVNREKLDKAIFLSDCNIKKICAKARISTQMMNYYRKGQYYPNVLIAVRLAEILNFKVEEIWNDRIGVTEEEV